jgi:peptidoglycan/LPS O-acetylase OafA/YrhL
VGTWAFTAGTTGVSFFFVLSGFVLAWSARPSDTATGFWRRRIARVYPVHLATALTALLLGATALPDMWPTSGGQLAANLALIHSWWPAWWQTLHPVSWSLACEAFFYAIFPALNWYLRRASTRMLTATAATGLSSQRCNSWGVS